MLDGSVYVHTNHWTHSLHHDELSFSNLQYLTDTKKTALAEPVPVRAVAMAILSLASHNFSSHIHGQIVNVDGGKVITLPIQTRSVTKTDLIRESPAREGNVVRKRSSRTSAVICFHPVILRRSV